MRVFSNGRLVALQCASDGIVEDECRRRDGAQRVDTAREPDMPASPIGSGCVDDVLSPEKTPGMIREIISKDLAKTPKADTKR